MSKGVLVTIALVVMAQYGSAAENLDSCCTTVSRKQITDPIIGYYTQRPNPPCVTAIIFQTEKGYFCSYLKSPWVLLKIRAFNNTTARDAALSTAPASSTVSPAVHHNIHCSILHSSSLLIPHSSLLIHFSLFLVLISLFLVLISLFLILISLFLILFSPLPHPFLSPSP
ncbi:hypothetical protein CesoFtcFv8_025413 [Champsocephalus esox]|uniref:Chemokine interleukin-8-like domain-containing protein n=1 Tax=Champsocephalus esox TaxID=159716 RepID=A0AAN8B3S2_9TELE|nr:hypothetical protein CesoFtcFv8_025413 [Champsocephalus esox]